MSFWSTPKNSIPPKTKGYLVLESDDGNIGDLGYLTLINEVVSEFTQWENTRIVPFSPNVNVDTLGTSGKMTVDDVLELQNRWGWEINSHGKKECGIGEHPVIANVSAGQNRIDVKGPHQLFRHSDMNYTYVISQGETEEEFQIASTSSEIYDDGHIITVSPLVNSYTAGATVQLSPQSMEEELQGWVDKARSLGIKGQNYANPWHGGGEWFYNQKAMDMLKATYKSARNRFGTANIIGNLDLYELNSFTMNEELTYEQIDTYLDNTVANNTLLIFYGHGGQDSDRPQKFKHLVRGALERGITILTRTEAVEQLA